MPRGGARPGAGRPSGSRNKKTLRLLEAVQERGITPLEYLLSVMHNEALEPIQRIQAAVAALPYVHSKLPEISPESLYKQLPDRGSGASRVVELVHRLYSELAPQSGPKNCQSD